MDGFLLIDKSIDSTSRAVVNKISSIYGIKKVGHTGTLDPLATGVLVVALGRATKLIDIVTSQEKEYVAEVQMGLSTDTLDITGEVLKESTFTPPTKEELVSALNSFLGTIDQEVPSYSAVRVNGKRLYEYARNKEKVTLPHRTVEIKEIELLSLASKTFTFRVKVSKGTYIRSLIRDIGAKLSIDCTMKSLRRTMQGNIEVSSCIPLEKVTKETPLIPMDTLLDAYPSYVILDEEVKKVLNGAPLENHGYSERVRIYDQNQNLLALYKVDPKQKEILRLEVLLKVMR